MIRDIFNMVIYSITNVQGDNLISSTMIIVFFVFVLIGYWLLLLYMYEKEDKYKSVNYLEDEEIFSKYNPLLAGCISQNRGVLARDIIAILLNLSNKGIVKLEVIKDIKVKSKNQYKYMLYRKREKEHLMDSIERQIHFMLFKYVHDTEDGIDLIKRLQDIPGEKVMYKKFQEIEKTAKYELNKIGANVNSVPKVLRICNVLLSIITGLFCIYHISQVPFNFEITFLGLFITLLIVSVMLVSMPLLIGFGYFVLKLIVNAKKSINDINEKKFYGKKIFSRSIEIILCTIIFMIAIALITGNVYLVIDVFVIGIACLIVGTDELMLKNNKEFLKDYESIRRLKQKIEKYSNIKETNVEQIKLWNEYLTYGVAFGIPRGIIEYLDGLGIEDEWLEQLENYDLLDASIEVFWQCKNNKNNKYSWFNKYDKYNEEQLKNRLEVYRNIIYKKDR